MSPGSGAGEPGVFFGIELLGRNLRPGRRISLEWSASAVKVGTSSGLRAGWIGRVRVRGRAGEVEGYG